MVTHLKLMVVLLLLIHGIPANGYRILGIFIHIGGSHFHTFYPIMNGLAQNGNDVTVLSYFPVTDSHANYKQFIFDGIPVINSSINLNELPPPSRSMYTLIHEFYELAAEGDLVCQAALNSSLIDDILRVHQNNPFDLVVTEIFNTECMLGVIHKMNVPYVGLTSCGLFPYHFDRVAMPDTPSYITSIYVGSSDEMNFYERLLNWMSMKVFKLMYRMVEEQDNRLLKAKFGDGIPDVHDLAKNIQLLLTSQHFSMSGSRPLSPQVVEIGGIHIQPEKEIPSRFKSVLDNSPQGVILISWGSHLNASSMPASKLASIQSALKRLNYQVIWKWELDVMPRKPNNVLISRWLPQRDLLCHPNVRLFWSHGGNLGTTESVWCGVPALITPFYGDQFVNSAYLKKRGMADTLLYEDLDEPDRVYDALLKLLNPRYAERAKIVSSNLRNRPMTPSETAVWWIQYILANGSEFIKSPATDMSWFVYYSLDVVFVLSCIFVLAVYIIVLPLKVLIKRASRSKVDSKKKD
ncbi:UDP-glycosyltransferase UGT5-like [Bradysia coprophila]|uniref:UDP-glycosyltransferase UGT5-like n=1 Tax=Bradysia coprophila TaxID=38358 RepID=UPI00187D773B|nr:UDP-glycosyltransferase UGT5-like [Bradysia coprophila]XP_037024344.1 UDP-glycosyltransferase UGT5-like [Bradysia coprophila]XP_037024345.1 UDP-glycosyltransferase UGT5-like [Bradysia coprophila]XP_037024346.1 UDP-glycosyltransferase UGT5-like [Bradysia coprophila]